MFKKILIFSCFSLLAITTAQAQMTIYGTPAKYNSKTGILDCGSGSGICAIISGSSMNDSQILTSNSKKTITVFTKEGKQDIQVENFKVVKSGEKTKVFVTPKK